MEIVVERTLEFTKKLLTFASVNSPPSVSSLATSRPFHALTYQPK